MALILLKRSIKGSKLTHAEMDNNWALIETAVDGKAATSHVHIIANVTGLQTALDDIATELGGKAETSHVHAITEVTGLDAALTLKIETSEKGAASGVASLGSDSIIPAAQMGITGKIVGQGRIQLTAGTSISLINPNWKQDGAGDTQLIMMYDRTDSLVNSGVLYPAATTTNNTTFVIKSTNGSDANWVLWFIVQKL